MKRKPQHGKRRVPGRFRPPVRPQLEVLEARLVMSAVPAAPVAKPVVLAAAPVFLPPAGLSPTNPGIIATTGNQAPPPNDDVFADALLQFGGGHVQEWLHFPASGGGNQDKPAPDQVGSAAPTQELESDVFASDLWSDGPPLVHDEQTALVLTQMSESLVP
jgi:hypothetical protein